MTSKKLVLVLLHQTTKFDTKKTTCKMNNFKISDYQKNCIKKQIEHNSTNADSKLFAYRIDFSHSFNSDKFLGKVARWDGNFHYLGENYGDLHTYKIVFIFPEKKAVFKKSNGKFFCQELKIWSDSVAVCELLFNKEKFSQYKSKSAKKRHIDFCSSMLSYYFQNSSLKSNKKLVLEFFEQNLVLDLSV